jgi:hypothetical protein
MDRGEHKVTGNRSCHSNLSCLGIANFPDHNDVGILTQDRSKGSGEGEARTWVHLDLIHSGHPILNRILKCDDIQLISIDLSQSAKEG